MPLTKSEFQLYRECPMHLWAKQHDQYDDETSIFDQHLIEQGYEVEKKAVEYLRSTLETVSTTLETQQTYTDGPFEARVDALVYDKENNTYDLYEIKSSTSDESSKEKNKHFDHLNDAAFQALILETQLPLRHVYLVTVNKDYVRNGALDLATFFVISCIDDAVANLRPTVLEQRDHAWSINQQQTPEGLEACVSPKTCPCPVLCHPNLPKHSIYDISGLYGSVKKDLRQQGIVKIADIPESFHLNGKQRRQVDVVKSGIPVIDRDAIRHELEKLTMPLCFLDYETFNPGIPLYDGYHPYEHMVFQYSLHVVEQLERPPLHCEYLVDHAGDPGREICAHLLEDMPKTGTVIAWNAVFEMKRNEQMAELYPEYAAFLLDLNARMYDLGDPFKDNTMYVLPEFNGSWSIKNVLPVLVPELSYKALAIGEGATAMKSWWELVSGALPDHEKEKIKEDLLKYCGLDTLAMVEIWKKLLKITQTK